MSTDKTQMFGRLDYKMTRKDWVLHLTATPSIIVLANYFIWGTAYFNSARIFIAATLLTSLLGLLLSVVNMRSMYLIRGKYPELSETGYRVLFSFLLYAVADVMGAYGLLWGYAQLPFGGFVFTIQKMLNATLVMVVAAGIATLGYEFFYSWEKWKEGILVNEQLQKLQLHTELNVLKSQVNPHFLFNSLNALSYLMADDVNRAEAYLSEMTKVYRYLLRNNTVELTALETELMFIRSYFAMLQTSNSSGVSLTISVPDHFMDYQLPPLTLQLLVENAVKHNVAHKEKPLNIQIAATSDGKLVVSNNLQRKLGKVHSNNVGLSNIAAKYRLMKQPEIEVRQTNNFFFVTLPLIAPKAGEVPQSLAQEQRPLPM